MIGIHFLRIFDAGKEIDLTALAPQLDRTIATSRTGFQQVMPKSIAVEETPLQFRMHPFELRYGDSIFDFSVVARIYSIGAISLCFIFQEPESGFGRLEEIGLSFSGQKGLGDHFTAYSRKLQEIVRDHIPDFTIDIELFEDYTIYLIDRLEKSVDPSVLLNGERVELSAQMREEINRNTLRYSESDIAIITWDSALLCSQEPPNDLLDLIEYANVQVLELRYYDRQITRLMARMYEDIGQAGRLNWWSRMQRYRIIMTDLMKSHAEVSEITEKVKNLIKVTEDVYYARVYATALRVIRSDQWTESLHRKIEVMRENYSMLADEVRNQHSNFLEWVIIILIAMEFVLGIWQSFQIAR
ncbi:MAG: hypothetical protein QHG99_09045 [Methanomicrobiales archaeon]|nr:hypothetical protein [Methanomicrobiales archaeon]